MKHLRSFIFVLATVALAPVGAAAPLDHNVMPAPAAFKAGDGRLPLRTDLRVALAGHRDVRLVAALARALRRLEQRTALGFPRTPGGAYAFVDDAASAQLVIACRRAAAEFPQLGEDESYALAITPERAHLRAETVLGALRGLETLLQLLRADASGWYLPAATITDAPRFPWRGVLLDPARHWLPPEVIKRTLDAMAVVKLNVLHLHLTDDQGFRIASKRHPRLHELGSSGDYYTQEQMRELIGYAAARGIRIVPEFDVPGHSTSWVVAYPEIASATGPFTITRVFGGAQQVLDPSNEKTYAVLDDFLGEMAGLFPDAYLHIGGDEVGDRHWKNNPRIQAFIAERGLHDKEGLQAHFNRRLHAILAKHGRKLVGWDEIVHPELPRDCVVQSWRGQAGLAAAARAGYAVLLSNGFYLDYMLSAREYYANEPLPAGAGLTPDEQRRVVGGEACMWGEWVSEESVESRLWPVTAAIAERLWSPREITDVADMYRRLEIVSRRLEEAGAAHLKNCDAMLRRLAGEALRAEQFETLRDLLALVQAAAPSGRVKAHAGTTQFTPLTRLADSLPTESTAARVFGGKVSDFVFHQRTADPQSATALANQLARWSRLAQAVAAIAPGSPLLADVTVAARATADATRIAGEALEFIRRGGTPAEDWRASQLRALAAYHEENSAGLDFPLLTSAKWLVAAAAAAPRKLSAGEWQPTVEQLARP